MESHEDVHVMILKVVRTQSIEKLVRASPSSCRSLAPGPDATIAFTTVTTINPRPTGGSIADYRVANTSGDTAVISVYCTVLGTPGTQQPTSRPSEGIPEVLWLADISRIALAERICTEVTHIKTANMAADSSLVDLHDASMSDDKDDLDSLPSISTDDIYSDTSDTDAQAEWERSLEQLQLILTMMIVPWMGKYFGRKFAYWSWSRYMEWAHNVDIRLTNKATFKAAGVVETAATL
ncbi:uncharacterized protein Y057_101 [Fusarium fujikuroi]|nr:uncharacterized protein Y057_101 [Fusarium fujikuroi]SCN78795.1 uncharacterized protein FFC1_03054 [Fusarium fujikuroi]